MLRGSEYYIGCLGGYGGGERSRFGCFDVHNTTSVGWYEQSRHSVGHINEKKHIQA